MADYELANIQTLDLFSGCGGSSLGAKKAGASVRAAIDVWELARDTYLDNFRDVKFYLDRIENVRPEDIEKQVGKIDLILASPECTNHTCARGSKLRSENSRMTAFEVIRFAQILKPRWMVIENVVHMKRWERYKEFIGIIKLELGYYVTEQTLDASAFDVPQSRRRLFIICDREKLPPKITPNMTRRVPASEVIDGTGDYQFSPLVTERRASATLKRAERAFSYVGYNTPFLLVYYGSDAAGGWQTIDRPLRTLTTLDRFAYVKPDGCGHLMRMLQVPEIKKAMGFPDNYKLNYGTRRDKIHMLGNAVCPPVIEAIIHALVKNNHECR